MPNRHPRQLPSVSDLTLGGISKGALAAERRRQIDLRANSRQQAVRKQERYYRTWTAARRRHTDFGAICRR